MDKNGRTMLVTYMAVRDKSGKYLGTMELVQDMEFAKEYFQKYYGVPWGEDENPTYKPVSTNLKY